MLVSFYFLSQGWAMATHFPFYILESSIGTVFHVWKWAAVKVIISCDLLGSLSFLLLFIYLSSLFHVIFLCFHFYIKIVVIFNLKLPVKDVSDAEDQTEQVLGLKEMVIPIFAGILSALRRVIARRVSLKVLSNFQFTLYSSFIYLSYLCILICDYFYNASSEST